ncbi:site-specific integrase [Streptomyces sp. NPDC048269]|uniref:tyrosine-type recombinase/integrase n=1 Tax=Streptomyces sp. NPDC048269 TaxID=3155753 RepID=UPI00343F8E70
MTTNKLVRGMGTFFKSCDHLQARWSKCPHDYRIRFRDASGRQIQESGFGTQEKAIRRLTEVYDTKRNRSRSQAKIERIEKYGPMRFREYAAEWRAGQRHLAESSVRHLDSLLDNHLLPALGGRRMNSFDHKVVEDFIRNLESAGIGAAAQSNAFDKLASILLDAHRLGIFEDNPLHGVKAPQYTPSRSVIPDPSQLTALRSSGDDTFRLLIDLMSGCGLRNGEAAAVNISNLVADDVYRITEQVNQTTKRYGPLKHRKPGDYREVPLPPRVRDTINWFAEKHGTNDGYLLRHPRDAARPFQPYLFQNQWQRLRKQHGSPAPAGLTIYSLRHFFASNCLSNGIPITDVAEWMGHKNIDVTFKIYRHLMPGTLGQAAKLLDLGLAA